MSWYIIMEKHPGGKWEDRTDPDNHWPSMKIKMHKMKKDKPESEFRIVKTNY